ncbi:MAG: hypothetical protein AVDCRST_MAG06-2320, partial [uncultured Nocardioides sp.]
ADRHAGQGPPPREEPARRAVVRRLRRGRRLRGHDRAARARRARPRARHRLGAVGRRDGRDGRVQHHPRDGLPAAGRHDRHAAGVRRQPGAARRGPLAGLRPRRGAAHRLPGPARLAALPRLARRHPDLDHPRPAPVHPGHRGARRGRQPPHRGPRRDQGRLEAAGAAGRL